MLGSREVNNVVENAAPDGADEIEVIRVVNVSKSGPNSNESSKRDTRKSSPPSEYRKQVDKLKAEVNECRRELRLAKEDKRRAERERDRARNERDDAQDKCKALEKKIHDLETENRNCEAIRQVTAAAVEASIEIITNREEERRRTIEQERDDAANKLLEAEKRIEAMKKAASNAVRLTFEFQAWRFRAALKAKKDATSQKEVNNNLLAGKAVVQKSAKVGAGAAAKDTARKRPGASSAFVGKRCKTDSANPADEELNQKLVAVLGGYSEPIAEKYKLFFVENLRGSVTIEGLAQFLRQRCPNDVEPANNILKSFSTAR